MSWPVRLWLTPDCFFVGRAVNAGAKGVRVTLSNRPAQAILHPGRQCRVEINAEGCASFWSIGLVRHVGEPGIGLELRELLPAELVSRLPLEGRVAVESPVGPSGNERDGAPARELVQTLPALAAVVIWAVRGMSDMVRESFGEGLEDSALAAVRHAFAQDWTAVGRRLDVLGTLVRYVARLDELSREECDVIQSALTAARDQRA